MALRFPSVGCALIPALAACTGADAGLEDTPAPPARPALCTRPGDDAVRDAFCGAALPTVTSLADLYRVLGVGTLGDQTYVPIGAYNTGMAGSVSVTLGHSTSLSGRLVSPINPRIIVPAGRETLLAFQRGVQKVEIAATNRDGEGFDFFLLTFRQACNDAPGGCRPGDLFTPSVESGWKSVTLEDDEALKNTPSDCRLCHQRTGGSAELLMRELEAPWTHFFSTYVEEDGPFLDGIDNALLARSYRLAKGDEAYGGVSSEVIDRTSGFVLQPAVPANQPLLFDTPTIFNERYPYVSGQAWPLPPVRSATWDREFEAFKRGEHLALPHFDLMVADTAKLEAASDAYTKYRAGRLAAAELPDLADVFSDDPQTRAEIGLEAEPDATPPEALIQACGACHNDVLDQSLSRARFNVGLSRLDRAEIATAVERLRRDPEAPGVMPPAEARQLTPSVRARVIEYLERGDFPSEDLAMLDHAAVMGMAGNTTPRSR